MLNLPMLTEQNRFRVTAQNRYWTMLVANDAVSQPVNYLLAGEPVASGKVAFASARYTHISRQCPRILGLPLLRLEPQGHYSHGFLFAMMPSGYSRRATGWRRTIRLAKSSMPRSSFNILSINS